MTSDPTPGTEEQLPPPPQVPTQATSPARPNSQPWLRRSADDRYVAGIAGGLADRLQFDPLIIRIGLVAATTFFAYAGPDLHGLVLIPYFLGWAIIPPAEGRSLVSRIREREALQELVGAFVVLVIAMLVLADTKYAIAVGLGAVALALFSDRTSGGPPANLVGEPEAGEETDAVSEVAAEQSTPTKGMVFGRNLNLGQRASGVFASRPPRPPRREPALWPLTLSLLVLIAIVSILIDRFTSPGMDPRIVVNLAMLAIGSVLLLSFWRGRARVTILWALALLPFWLAFSIADVGRFEGEGTDFIRLAQDDLSTEMAYELGYGDLTVDFRNVVLAPGSETTMSVDLTAGSASVIVPRDVTLKIDGKVGLGSYNVQGHPYWYHSAGLANGEIRRTFSALGNVCFQHELDQTGLADMARFSGVPVASGADVVDAIEAAGFERPVFSFTGQVETWHQDSNGGEFPRVEDVDYYRIDVSDNGTLCQPEDPPSNPATLIIQPTVGIGTLEISRVDIS